MRDISNGWVALDDRNIFVMAARSPVATDDMGTACNIDLQLVGVRLLKRDVGIYVKFLEYRSITTLGRRVQKI